MSSKDDSLSVPLPMSSSSPSWQALVATLTSKGILCHPQSPMDETRTCATVADLMQIMIDKQPLNEENDDTIPTTAITTSPPPLPVVLVLVGGSWCAPCRNFTSVLISCTNDNQEWLNHVKVIFCSADHDEISFQSYFRIMPMTWSAIPFDEEDEDERDNLLEALQANSLPCLLVFDPLSGSLLEQNAVHAVQAGGSEGFVSLVEKWRDMVAKGISSSNDSAAIRDEKKENETSDDNDNNTLHYFIPAPPSLICQYFKERLLSPNLPNALKSVILRREAADEDAAAEGLAETMLGATASEEERILFRTTAPALPVNWYGSSVFGLEATAIECWQVERNNDNAITKATCTIENETGRIILVFRETIVMEATDDGYGTNVTKTLNLDGVPTIGHGPFQRRWKTESDLIFHALLGSCDRKKKLSS